MALVLSSLASFQGCGSFFQDAEVRQTEAGRSSGVRCANHCCAILHATGQGFRV